MKTLSYPPYDWQIQCLQAWKEHQYRGIANVVTGAGKTMLALFAIEHLRKEHPDRSLAVRIIVPTLELQKQWKTALKLHFALSSLEIGCYSSKFKSSSDRPFMIYIVNSARAVLISHALADIAAGHDIFLIADECHHYASPENRKIFRFISHMPSYRSLYTLGLSATPQVPGYDTVLVPSLGQEIYHYNHQMAICQNTLSSFALFQIGLHFLADEKVNYVELSDKMAICMAKLQKSASYLKKLKGTAFFSALRALAGKDDSDLSDLAKAYLLCSFERKKMIHLSASRLLCLEELVGQLGISEKIIVYCERIIQANSACQILEKLYPGKIGCYHSAQSKDYRNRIMDSFREGSIRILVACHCLDEGIDVPDASIGIILSGTSIPRQRIQRLGRILRKSNKKEIAVLYYLYLKDSSEEAAYLPDLLSDVPTTFLSYYPAEGSFRHPVYEDACLAYLKELEAKHLSKEKILEARNCLLSGLVRPDWLFSTDTCDKRIQSAASIREKNYWICIKALKNRISTNVRPK